MKRLAFILSILLALLNGCGRETSAAASLRIETGIGRTVPFAEVIADNLPGSQDREMRLAPVTGNISPGDTISQTVSFRLTQTGKRVNPSAKTSSRIIKAGRITDTYNYNTFLSACFAKTDGALSFKRLIYSICRLRL